MGSASSVRKHLFDKTHDVWQKRKTSSSDVKLNKHLKEVYDCLHATENFPLAKKVERQKKEGERLVCSGSLVVLCERLIALLKKEEQDDQDGGTVDSGNGEALKHVLWSVAIAAENCHQVCQAVLHNPDLLTTLASRLEAMVQLFERSDSKQLKVSRHWYRNDIHGNA